MEEQLLLGRHLYFFLKKKKKENSLGLSGYEKQSLPSFVLFPIAMLRDLDKWKQEF